MTQAYLCPLCKRNRQTFQYVYKLLQEVVKHEQTGEIVFESDEFVSPVRQDGSADIDVKCERCGYIASEGAFLRAAKRHRDNP